MMFCSILVLVLSATVAQGQLKARQQDFDGTNRDTFTDTSNFVRQGEFRCPKSYGDFHDDVQCDKFWRCENGVATATLCDDGLVFDITKADGRDQPCDSPYVVDCGDLTELQEPTFPSIYCPRRNGYFAHPDPSICNVYYTCIEGSHTETACSSGLQFNEASGNCDWPSVALRQNCSDKARSTHKDGFTCPEQSTNPANTLGVTNPHPSYPNLDDCQKFYVCLNGKTPQEASCPLGQVFNEKSMLCDFSENVPECKDWYINDPRLDVVYDDTNLDGKPDFGIRRDFSQTSINK